MSESNPASAPLTHRSTVEAPMPQDMIGKRALVTGAEGSRSPQALHDENEASMAFEGSSAQ
jgi:hypothetical protein